MTKRKKNILIVGASGFVGRALTQKLNKPGNTLFLVAQKKKFRSSDHKVFYGDLNDEKFCRQIVENIDAVYYLAAYKKNIAYHTQEPFGVLLANVKPLLVFLDALRKSKVKTLLYLSSAIVEYVEIEKDKQDGYVFGKYVNEVAIKTFANQFKKIDVKIVRSSAIYGPGDNYNPKTANFIPAVIGRVFKSKDQLEVWGRGTRKMQFIYIDDLVDNLIAVAKSKKDFFVVGNPRPITVNQVVDKIIKFSSKKLKVKHDLSKPDKSTKLIKFKNIIKPRVGFEDGLEEAINYYLEKWPKH